MLWQRRSLFCVYFSLWREPGPLPEPKPTFGRCKKKSGWSFDAIATVASRRAAQRPVLCRIFFRSHKQMHDSVAACSQIVAFSIAYVSYMSLLHLTFFHVLSSMCGGRVYEFLKLGSTWLYTTCCEEAGNRPSNNTNRRCRSARA